RCRDYIVAVLLGTRPGGAGALGGLFHQVRRAAFRALLIDHFVPTGEGALGIAAASVEQLAPAAAALQDFALMALRAVHAGLDGFALQLLDPVAFRIARAAQKFAEPRAPAHHRAPALLAHHVGGRRGCRFPDDNVALLVARELLGVAAFRIVRAGQELAVAPELDHHVA